MPVDLDCYSMAIRGLWVEYDHYSDQCLSYLIPIIPNDYLMNENLLKFCNNEYEIKCKIRKEQMEGRKLRIEEKKTMVERLINPVQIMQPKIDKKGKTKKINPPGGKVKKIETEIEPEPLPYLPTLDEIILQKEGKLQLKIV